MQGLIEQLAAKLDQPLTPDERAGARPDRVAAHNDVTSRDRAPDSQRMAVPQSDTGPGDGTGAIASVSPPVEPAEKATPTTAPAPIVADEAPTAPLGHLAVVAEAVEAKRMDVYLDPIMGLSDRKARHFELTVRLRDDMGQEIEPALYGAGVAGTGLLARIDAAKLEQAAEIVQRLKTRQSKAALFSSLTGESLADENFLGSFADLLTDEDGMGARLVLNFSQAEARNFSTVHWQSISAMASIGLKFALEGVTDLDMDFETLQENGFAFVKLDASVFLEGLPMPGGHVPPTDICRHLAGLGFGLIVGGIVAEKDLARIHGFGAVLGQGTLFGAPRSVALERARRAA